MEKRYEEYAYILDLLPHGRAGIRPGYRAGAVVQVVGEGFFTLLGPTTESTSEKRRGRKSPTSSAEWALTS